MIEAYYLAGRCANGSELDSGTLWHALENIEQSWTALCGAKPGRRSAGWRGYPDEIHAVTCKRCLAKMGTPVILTDDKIDRLIRNRAVLTNRRDEHINRPAVDEIDEQLRQVPPGQRNDVDLLLFRDCAKLPERRWMTTPLEWLERDVKKKIMEMNNGQ